MLYTFFMRYGRYGWSHFFLSFGLGIVFAWIGVDILRHPDIWIGYLPQAIPFGLSRELALKINGGVDLAIGVSFLLRSWPKLTAFFAVAHLAGIIFTQGIDAVLIRDVGLLGTALALFMWPQHHHRRHILPRFFRKPANHLQDP